MLNTAKRLLLTLPAKIAIGCVLFYLLFAYFAVNPIAQQLIPWVADKQLASKASVGKVTFDPLRLKLTVDDLKLTEKNQAPLASVDQLVVDMEASGIFELAWKFKEIRLLAPKGLLTISSKGVLNWDALIAKLNEDPSPPSDTIPRVLIGHILVKQGDVQYVDYQRQTPFKANLSPLDFELDGFSTLPRDRGDYLIVATFAENGGTLKWKGNMGVNPVASKGSIAIEGVQLHKIMRIVKDSQLPFKANAGQLHANVDYDFSLPQNQPKLVLNQLQVGGEQLNALVNDVGEVRADSLNISVPRLHLSTQNLSKQELNTQTQLTIALQQLDVSVNALSVHHNIASVMTLDTLQATLPALNFQQTTLNEQSKSQTNQPQLTFEQLNVAMSGFNLSHQQKSLLHVPQIQLQNIGVDLANSHVTVAQVILDKGALTASRNQAGQLDWQTAFSPQALEKSAKDSNLDLPVENMDKAETASPAFAVNIANIALNHWKLDAKDQSFTNPLQLNIADINVNFAVNNPEDSWQINGLQTKLNQLTLQSSLFKQPVATVQTVALNQGDIQLKPQQVNVESVFISGIKTALVMAPDMPVNWQRILATSTRSKQNGQADKPNHAHNARQTHWKLALKKLAVANSQLHIEDQNSSNPVLLEIQKIAVEVRDASLDLRRTVPVKSSFAIAQGGRFEAQGKFAPAPFNADLQLKLADVSFKPFAPYINQFALLKLNDGSANLQGKLSVKSQSALSVNFNGGFSVDKLALVEEASNAPFLAWDQVASDQLTLSVAPNRLHMASLNIRQPTGKFIINTDKSTNLARILRNQSTASAPVVEAPSPAVNAVEPTSSNDLAKPKLVAPPNVIKVEPVAVADAQTTPDAFPVSIETIRVENGALEFADLSLTPQFGTAIHALSGVINGVSTNVDTTAQVELDGKVDDYGAARIRGSVKPFKATQFTDLKLTFTNLDMSRLTPYSGKFAGRRIDAGKLSVDLAYNIKQRQLAGENKFVINKLKLGEKVDSADAANLPLDLAIAILEDSDGLIDLDLPITGSLDDPQFSYGSIIWKAIRNVLSKIVTAPFRALGKLFGGDGEKLEALLFEAGSTALSPPELEKIKHISQALTKRQGLALGIVPSYDPAADTRALQETAIRRQVLAEMGVTLAPEQAPGPIDLSNPKAQKAVQSLHDNLTKKSLLKKLAATFEKPPPGYYEAALEKLITSDEIKEADLQGLALARGKAIQQALIEAGIAAERARIDNAVVAKADAKTNTIRVKLTIDVKVEPKQSAQ